MDYTEPQEVNGETAAAAELTLTIYSGYAGKQEVITATARAVPLHENEEDYTPILEATINATARLGPDTPPDELAWMIMIQQGIRGYFRTKYGLPV